MTVRAADGVLIVDKPPGMTSHQVVAAVSRALGGVKAGHAGTLDPMASGVLVVCLGEATKLAGVLAADDKVYEGELELGADTDTLDADGRIVRERRAEAAAVTRAGLAAAMARLVGRSAQVPPMYSAVRIGGRRLHQLARAGAADIARPPRAIEVRRFDLLSFDSPRARFAVDCSKGTFVRALVADAGEALGCGAHLVALRRIRSGPFAIDRAIPLDQVDRATAAAHSIDLAEAVGNLPRVELPDDLRRAASTGKPLSWNDLSSSPAPPGVFALVARGGTLVALAEVVGDRVKYRRVFTTS